MSIRVNEIPEANSNYDLTNKKILIHDLTISPTGSTKLLDLGRLLGSNTNISDGDKGDILVSSLGAYWVIKNNIISLEKLSKLSGNTLLGNPNSIIDNASAISLGSSLSFTGSTLNVISNTTVQKVNIQQGGNFISGSSILNFIQGANITLAVSNDTINNRINIQVDAISSTTIANGDYGDIVVTNSGNNWKINNQAVDTAQIRVSAVTYDKIRNVNVTSLLGNPTTFADIVSEITLTPSLRFNGTQLDVVPDSSIQKVSILSAGALISSRKAINFNFTNLGYSITDDNANNRVNINLSGLPGTTILYKNGLFVGSQSILNLIEGSNTTITTVNNIGQQRLDITVQASNQSLQLITDTNNVTTNNLIVTNAAGYISVTSLTQFGGVTIGQTDNSIGGYLRLANNSGNGGTVQVSNLTAQRILELPNGNGVIPLTVNGVGANSSGNIVITAGNIGITNYKVYIALLNQTSTGAPVATVLENTLGGVPVWTRFSTGRYQATLTGVFPINKTVVFASVTNTLIMQAYSQNVDIVELYQTNTANANVDGMSGSSIEIRVYN